MKNFEPEKDEDVQKFGAKVICTMFACLILGFLKLNPLLGLMAWPLLSIFGKDKKH